MARVPASVADLIDFCSAHATRWTPSPAGLGITPADVTKLKADLSAAQAALAAQMIAKNAAKSATLDAKNAVADLRTTIATLVRTIVNFAEASTKPDAIFADADLEPTAPRSPSQPPGTPTDMTAALDTDGNLTLKWKCVNPPGGTVVYAITRRTGSAGPFTQVGLVGTRRFTDQTIPAGAAGGVTYQIRGIRGQLTGPASVMFTLPFGHAGGGGGDVQETQLKMAA